MLPLAVKCSVARWSLVVLRVIVLGRLVVAVAYTLLTLSTILRFMNVDVCFFLINLNFLLIHPFPLFHLLLLIYFLYYFLHCFFFFFFFFEILRTPGRSTRVSGRRLQLCIGDSLFS